MTKFEFITAAIKKSDKKTLANILIHLADNFVVEEYLWNVYSDKDVGLIIKDDVNKKLKLNVDLLNKNLRQEKLL